MSLVERRLIGHLIGHSFGQVCQRVADLLLVKGPSHLAALMTAVAPQRSMSSLNTPSITLNPRLVKEALVILIHHGLVSWSETEGTGMILYRLWPERCILRLLMPMVIAGMEEERAVLMLRVFKEGMVKLDGDPALCKEGWLREAGHEETASEEEGEPVAKRKKVAKSEWFTVNYDQVLRHYLHHHLIQQCQDRLNLQAAQVMQQALLHASLVSNAEETVSHVNTFQIDVEGLPKPSIGRRGAGAQSPVQPFLEAAGNALDWFAPVPGHAQQLWSLDWSKAARRIQLDSCLAYVQGRWGQASARLMRILEEKGPLDDRSMATHALMLATDVRTRLYAMLREGLVHLIEVPRSADHAASRSLHLWTLPPIGTRLRLARRQWLLQVITNLWERAHLERQRQAVLISKAERTDVAASLDTLLTEAERKQLFSLRRTLWRLHYQIITLMRDQVVVAMLAHPKQLA